MFMEKFRESADAEDDVYKKAYDVICKKLGCNAIDVVSDDKNFFLYLRFKEQDVSDRYAVTMQMDAARRYFMRIHVPSRLLPSCMMCSEDELKKMSSYKKIVVEAVLEACSNAPVVLPDKTITSDWRAVIHFGKLAASVCTAAIEKGTTLEMLLMAADLEAGF